MVIIYELIAILYVRKRTFPVAQMVKNLPAMQKTQDQSLGQEDPLEKNLAIHPSVCAWRIPWIEDPGGLQSMGSQRVRHTYLTYQNVHTHTYENAYMHTHITYVENTHMHTH